jgi:DNA polymerase-3 subunit alpha
MMPENGIWPDFLSEDEALIKAVRPEEYDKIKELIALGEDEGKLFSKQKCWKGI